MEVLQSITSFQGQNSLLVLGMLDGVHLGHQALIARAKALKASIGGKITVLTFANHPKGEPLITTAEEKLAILDKLGVEVCMIPAFTQAVKHMEPEEFVALIEHCVYPIQTIVGFDYRFGKDRKGDGALLQKLMHGHRVQIIPKVEVLGEKVSSSRLRSYVLDRDFDRFRTCCGRRYFMSGETVHGNQRGGKHGRPTINLPIPKDKLIPPYGVYAVQAVIGGGRYNGVANLGTAPTFASDQPVLEVHLLDVIKEDLYHQPVKVLFYQFLREIQRFASPEELYLQVAKDVQKGKKALPNVIK